MARSASRRSAAVTYRATRPSGEEVEIRLVANPDLATAARAWAALCAVHGDVDPRSIEIEIRACAGAAAARPGTPRGALNRLRAGPAAAGA